ncbi:MAG: DUF898 domain-containing protein [Deltaproteobacteria bacterium]|nr:DUF898 domain-containing protein [Deltaproteobacteria bacterium]
MSHNDGASGNYILKGAPGSGEPRLLRSSKVEFKGTAGEYFRIWAVNTCLTIVTCGLYLAWAKVRKRRYFYSATLLDGRPFSYTADPKAIFKGYLIITVCLILINVTNFVHPLLNTAASLLFGVLFPFLIHKSLRFRARHTVYCNIPFRFHGELSECYRVFFFAPMLIPITLGLFIPYWDFLRKRYFYGKMGYGSQHPDFCGKAGAFYLYYLLGVAVAAVVVVVPVFFFYPLFSGYFTEILMNLPEKQRRAAAVGLTFMGTMLVGFIVVTVLNVILYAKTTVHCLEHTSLGRVQFICELRAPKLLWIQISNLVAVLLSVGLLAPWAQVRKHRYVAESITVVSDASLSEFTAGLKQQEVGAVGDAATDFFDMEIGL